VIQKEEKKKDFGPHRARGVKLAANFVKRMDWPGRRKNPIPRKGGGRKNSDEKKGS